ncbi:hypothetical protein ACIRBX_11275 [Kitasatospora sp. NPDC096147]|uniref:hypothetical protein n=1 Tax=Kitasatospora sp. NPDC096147 TaxID=3364093 RepID=UPI00381ACB2B
MINEPRRPRGELAHPSYRSGEPSERPDTGSTAGRTGGSAHVPAHGPAHGQGHGPAHSAAGSAGGGPTIGHQAAAQLLGLREVALPAAVIAAADLLLDDALRSADPVTREAAAVTRGRLRAALGQI